MNIVESSVSHNAHSANTDLESDLCGNFDTKKLVFYVNGRRIEEALVDPRTTLAAYLRDHLHLKGTKIGCNEGGCGACTVMISDVDPIDDSKIRHYSANACITPVCAIFGKAITTVEGIGGPLSASKRLHPVQERLTKMHGSQCGFCTPGFVMAMYALLRNSPTPSQSEIDESMQGNLCRCTGYRPILEAFYSFIPTESGTAKLVNNCSRSGNFCCKNNSSNSTEDRCCKSGGACCKLKTGSTTEDLSGSSKRLRTNSFNKSAHTKNGLKHPDLNGLLTSKRKPTLSDKAAIELVERAEKLKLTNLDDCALYDATQEPIFPPELQLHKWHKKSFAFQSNGIQWLQPTSLDHLLALKRIHPHARLISGNSELAVELKFRFIPLSIAINPKQVPELREVRVDESHGGVYMGMGLSLTEMKDALTRIVEQQPRWKTAIFRSICEILYYFAGKHVRNMASVAGNIATASPISDLNPIWMAAGARVVLASEERGERQVAVDEKFFVGYRRTTIQPDEVLIGIWIPFSAQNQYFKTYKQAQRREDDIAIVTGAFSVKFEENEMDKNLKDGQRKRRRGNTRNCESHIISELQISYGGMAPTTKLVSHEVCGKFVGRRWDDSLLEELSSKIAEELRLPADVPGGMPRYRMALTLSFLFKFYAYATKHLGPAGGEVNDTNFIDNCEESDEDERKNPPRFHATQIYQDVPQDQPAKDPVGRPLMHQSGEKHTTGEAVYSVDTKIFGCLHMAYVTSPVASGTLNTLDAEEALALDGVVDFVDASDVPGSQTVGHENAQIFVKDEISYHGQPLAAIVAVDHETARRAANLVKIDIIPPNRSPMVTMEDAIREESYPWHPIRVHSARAQQNEHSQNVELLDVSDAEWRVKYPTFVEGKIRIGGQEHFYLETHNCVVIPDEGGEVDVISSTQCVNDVQHDVASALALPSHKVRVSVRRIGGGFGGKESACGIFAAAAAVAAVKLKRAVRLVLERFDDMAISGTRHPFLFRYKLAIDVPTRRLLDFNVRAYNNAGYQLGMSKGIMERCVTHMDGVYKFENADFVGRVCKTNTASNTAFRGFGAPQAMFATETALQHAAEEFGIDIDELRESNFYEDGDCTPFGMHLHQCNARNCFEECRNISDFTARRDGPVAEFNLRNRYRKRGICLTPTKFGIGFGFKQLNQAGALVHVYTDGSVLVSHAGMEMGQGLHIKILQIAARCLEIDISLIQIHNTATDKVPNASPTAASVGSDMNGLAVQDACKKLMERLKPFRDENPNKTWAEWVMEAYVNRVSLSATGFAIIHSETVDFLNGRGAELYGYCVYGAACTEVEVDCLTGDHHILRTDIVMDIGDSLNPAVDIGQIEGAFIQGYGLFTMEELKIRPNGIRLTRGPGTYKIPSADDVPREFHVKLLKGSSNKRGIFSSKAVGEPPLFLGASAFFAIREAIRAYRRAESGLTSYFRFDSPATPERIRMACEDKITEKVPALPTPANFTPWTIEM